MRHNLLYAWDKIKHTGPNYTFIKKESILDYVSLNNILFKQLRYSVILEEGVLSSTSDHLSIIVVLDIDHFPYYILNRCEKIPAWYKTTDIQLKDYLTQLHEPIDLLLHKLVNLEIDINSAYDEFVIILL